MKTLSVIKYYWKTTLVLFVIRYLSLMKPIGGLPVSNIPFFDKWVHLFMYFGLSIIMLIDWFASKKNKNLKVFIFVFLFCAFYGGLLELLQQYFPPRTTSFADFITNVIGCSIGVCIGYFAKKEKK